MSDEPQPQLALPRGLAALGYRDFALYWAGQSGSNFGSHMEQVAATWVLYDLTGSALLAGFVGVFRAVPFLVVTPFAGAIADRVDQRRVLLVTQSLGLLNSLTLGLLLLAGAAEPWHIYLQMLLQTTVTAFDVTARQALFPGLVARRHIGAAVTLNAAGARAASFLGPATSGWLLVSVGHAAPFLANAASFLALIAAVIAMRPHPRPPRSTTSIRSDLASGLRHVARSPLLSGILKLEASVALFSVNPAILAVFAREVLGTGADGLGWLMSAQAFGALLGTSLLLWFSTVRHKGRVILGGGAVYALALLALSGASALATAAAVLFVAGVADAAISTVRQAALHLAAPPALRGRTIAAMVTVRRGLQPLSQTQSGIVASLVGAPLAIAFAGTAMAGAVLVATVRNRALRGFTSDDDAVPTEDEVAEAEADAAP